MGEGTGTAVLATWLSCCKVPLRCMDLVVEITVQVVLGEATGGEAPTIVPWQGDVGSTDSSTPW